jgi:hypothetical protein
MGEWKVRTRMFSMQTAGAATSGTRPPANDNVKSAYPRPWPGGPPMRAPDGHLYVYAPHAGGLYQRVVMQWEPRPGQAHRHAHLWQMDEELVASVMRNHPGLKEEEARRHLELFGRL